MNRQPWLKNIRKPWILFLAVLYAGSAPLWGKLPPLHFEVSEGLEAMAVQLQAELSRDPSSLEFHFAESGFEVSQRPVRVILASERSPWARRAAPWVSGYAQADRDLIVLIPSRISYPQSSVHQTLIHELAHIYSHRATDGNTPPRWFSEGFALLSARQLSVFDRGRSLLIGLRDPPTSAYQLDFEFYGAEDRVHAAYALSGALVRFLTERYGEDLPHRIFSRMKEGDRFRVAFRAETGSPLHQAEKPFWKKYQRVFWWVLGITSSSTLWIAITLLFLLATWRKRKRLEAVLERWELEDRGLDVQPTDPGEVSDPWVH